MISDSFQERRGDNKSITNVRCTHSDTDWEILNKNTTSLLVHSSITVKNIQRYSLKSRCCIVSCLSVCSAGQKSTALLIEQL